MLEINLVESQGGGKGRVCAIKLLVTKRETFFLKIHIYHCDVELLQEIFISQEADKLEETALLWRVCACLNMFF